MRMNLKLTGIGNKFIRLIHSTHRASLPRVEAFNPAVCLLSLGLFAGGCATPQQTAGLVVSGTVATVARTPSQELEQVYYVGVFDPEEQLQPTVYRLTVRGQSSMMSFTKFASGWVPAGIIDSLNGTVSMEDEGSGKISYSKGDSSSEPKFNFDRRLVMFGPEGFREAPRNHRLVIVMGANPKGFFEAVDGALGEISGVSVERRNAALEKQLFEALLANANSQENLLRFKADLADVLPASQKP